MVVSVAVFKPKSRVAQVAALFVVAVVFGGACESSTGVPPDAGGQRDATGGDGALVDGGLVDGGELDGGELDGQVAEVCNGLDDDGDGLVDEGLEATCGPCGRPYDLAVPAPYPIGATFMYARTSACQWQDGLEAFHRQGGQVVWQLSPAFGRPTAAQLRVDPEFATCTQGSLHCVDAALADLQAVNPANTVANFLTYYAADGFSNTILSCPALDREITVGARTYWRLVLPHNAGQTACDFNGGSFDVLFVRFDGFDNQEALLRTADAMQMQVVVGLPAAPAVVGQEWNLDLALRPAFLEWSRRVMEDYASRLGGYASFTGVYQGFETKLVGSGLNNHYDMYGQLAPLIHTLLPGRVYAVSPYWDVNVDQGDDTVASVKEGFKRMARQGVDLIAPQDGRGTAKAALFWPHQQDTVIETVDPVLASFDNVVGTRTFSQQFNASTQQLYAAVREAVAELATDESVAVTLWANVEAFENSTDAPCGFSFAKDRTDKQRVDWALTFAGAFPTGILSFMWDAYYLCLDGGYAQSLHDEILGDYNRPITTQAFFWNGGLVVRGFHLAAAGTVLHLTWYDAAWNAQSATVSPTSTSPGWGASNQRSPMLDEVWLPFDDSDLAPSFYVHITAEGAGGLTAHHIFSMAY